jgi:hypothetical protein
MATPDQSSPIEVEELHNDIQRALATTVNEMLAEGLRGDNVLDRIVEDIQPAVLFHPDVRPHSKVSRQVRDILISLGMSVDSRHGYPIIRALACVYPERQIRDDALAYASNAHTAIAQSYHEGTTNPRNDANNYAQRDSARAVGSLLNMYKDQASKYGRTIKENVQETFDKYLRVIDDLQIPSEKGLQILHNMLTGEALSFYSTISNSCQTLSDAHQKLEAEFMSAAQQNAARRDLDSLDFPAELAKANSPIKALQSIRTTITRVITQCPERYRGEKFRIDFLRRAIQGEPWAADPIARKDGDDDTFTQFYNNVATRLTLATQNNTISGGFATARIHPHSATQLPIPSFYGERLTCTLPNKRTNSERPNYSTASRGNVSIYSTTPRACFNCGSFEQFMARWPKPRSTVIVGRERLLTTLATELLFEALDQLDLEPNRVLNLAEETYYIDRKDEVNVYDTLLALARTPPSTHSPVGL